MASGTPHRSQPNALAIPSFHFSTLPNSIFHLRFLRSAPNALRSARKGWIPAQKHCGNDGSGCRDRVGLSQERGDKEIIPFQRRELPAASGLCFHLPSSLFPLQLVEQADGAESSNRPAGTQKCRGSDFKFRFWLRLRRAVSRPRAAGLPDPAPGLIWIIRDQR